MTVTETFFSVLVADMARAKAFYVAVFGAEVAFATPQWTSLMIAKVRVGLAHDASYAGGWTGLHFAVDDLDAVLAHVEKAGGRVVSRPAEVAPGVVLANIADTEGNAVTLRRG